MRQVRTRSANFQHHHYLKIVTASPSTARRLAPPCPLSPRRVPDQSFSGIWGDWEGPGYHLRGALCTESATSPTNAPGRRRADVPRLATEATVRAPKTNRGSSQSWHVPRSGRRTNGSGMPDTAPPSRCRPTTLGERGGRVRRTPLDGTRKEGRCTSFASWP